MRNGRGEADLGAQRRDHEGPRVEHGAGAKRAPLRERFVTEQATYTLAGPPELRSATDATCRRTTTQPEQGGRRPPWTPRKRCCRRPSREPEGTRRGYRSTAVGAPTGTAVPVRLYQASRPLSGHRARRPLHPERTVSKVKGRLRARWPRSSAVNTAASTEDVFCGAWIWPKGVEESIYSGFTHNRPTT